MAEGTGLESGIGKGCDSYRFERHCRHRYKYSAFTSTVCTFLVFPTSTKYFGFRLTPTALPLSFLDLRMPPSIMFSTVASDKPMSEKQRLKFEKFKQKQENLAQKSQHISERKTKRQGAPMVAAKDWIEETPAGHRKILKPLDDDFHKAYLPKVVESAWYSFWEGHGLFKPQTEKDGRLKPKGKYVIAMPPPNVCTRGSISAVVIC